MKVRTSQLDWETLASRSFVPLHVISVRPGFSGSMDHRTTDRTGVTHIRAGAHEVIRTQSLIDRSASDVVLFSVQLRGVNDVRQGDSSARVLAGNGVLYLSDRPYELRFPQPAEGVLLQFPIAYLGIQRKRLQHVTARALPVLANSTLNTCLRVLRSLLSDPPMPPDPREATRVSVELLSHALREQLDLPRPPRSRTALLAAFQQRIVDGLEHPGLDVAALATAESQSVRTVHNVFATVAETTPARYIRQMRLKRAQHLLTSTSLTISDIAAVCGFSEARTLTRAFRREHGLSPGAFRAQRPPSEVSS